jgi:hypothetical protein
MLNWYTRLCAQLKRVVMYLSGRKIFRRYAEKSETFFFCPTHFSASLAVFEIIN